jgi:transmembrane sensor
MIDSHSHERRAITEQAAGWSALLESADARPVPEFWQWLTRSPEHVREVLLMSALTRALRSVDPEGRIALDPPTPSVLPEPRGEDALPRDVETKGFFWRRLAWSVGIAATLALGCGLAFFLRTPTVATKTFSTEIGELRSITFEDGSTVVLDATSRLEVRYSDHERAFFLEGQALFNVAHDPRRPFRVRTKASTIEAMGTQFNVRTERVTTVAVLDGVVRLWTQVANSPGRPTAGANTAQLGAGEGVSVNREGEITERVRVNPTTVIAWEQRQLVFSRTPLEDIAREFNRYNFKDHLRVEGRAASLRFGGVFDATDPVPLLLLLQRNPSIVVERVGDEVVIRDRS